MSLDQQSGLILLPFASNRGQATTANKQTRLDRLLIITHFLNEKNIFIKFFVFCSRWPQPSLILFWADCWVSLALNGLFGVSLRRNCDMCVCLSSFADLTLDVRHASTLSLSLTRTHARTRTSPISAHSGRTILLLSNHYRFIHLTYIPRQGILYLKGNSLSDIDTKSRIESIHSLRQIKCKGLIASPTLW